VGEGVTVLDMKRASLVTSVAFLLAVGCGPKGEPKQANIPDPTPEEGTASSSSPSGNASSSSSSSGSSSSSRGGGDILGSPSKDDPKSVAKGPKGEATNVANLGSFMDAGLKWGMSHQDVTKLYTDNGGVIWKDFDEKLSKARVGPEMNAIENMREDQKRAFARSYIEFKDTPTGYDATAIKGEYTYKNKESLMWIAREGKPKRYFFFINDRLWKIYDEVPLSDTGAYGKAYIDAVNTLNAKLGAQGRILSADAAKGINATTVDWKDGSNHLRAVDRSNERVVAVVLEDNATLSNLASLRHNKAEDPTAIDPSIAAVTGGQNRTDPNAPAASGSAKPGTKPPATKPKK
jgi:hypothetical protein